MAWQHHRLRDSDVWARVDDNGALVTDREGRVEIVYKPVDGAKVYRAGARNLSKVVEDPPVELTAGERAPERPDPKKPEAAAPADAIHVWTDGACSGNPGPSGIGVVIIDGKGRTEISEFLGHGTNNIAELTAIQRGLEQVTERKRTVCVYTDSQYSIGVLVQGNKAKKNVELVASLRELCGEFSDLRMVKVAGHSGIPLNERTDQLAVMAVETRSSSTRNVTPMVQAT